VAMREAMTGTVARVAAVVGVVGHHLRDDGDPGWKKVRAGARLPLRVRTGKQHDPRSGGT
jgi:hypothetical protein